MTEHVTIIADGKELRAQRGESLLEVLRRAGIDVPALCHHAKLAPYGACRLCLVEVANKPGGRRRLTTSCNYPALDGIAVLTNSERIARERRLVMELILARAPKAPKVVAMAKRLGVAKTRFAESKDNCILCGLCVRVCREAVGANALSLAGRGFRRRATTPFVEHPPECIGCGACTALCPTGRMQMERKTIERLRALPGAERPCRYGLMGLLPAAICGNDYNCAFCEVEQRIAQVGRDRPDWHPVFLARESAG